MKTNLKPTSLRARKLRHTATDAEIKLWQALRSRQLAGYKFRRQHPIGKYVADFACVQYKIVIEADGGQHAENQQDEIRTHALNAAGWKVLRFWNHGILTNIDGVVETIEKSLLNRHLTPHQQ